MRVKRTIGRSAAAACWAALGGFSIAIAGCEIVPADNNLGDNGGDTCKCDTGIQVTIEARFLLVSDNFLGDVGVDFDTNFILTDSPATAVQYPPTPFVPGDGFSVASTTPGSTSANALTTLTGTTGAGTNSGILGTFLTDLELDVILRAVENDAGTRLLTAPHLTVTGNQNAFIFIYDEQPLQGDLQPDFVSALQAVDPLIFGINTGPSVEVRNRGVQDDNYVVLDIRPSVGGTFNTPDESGDRPIVRTSDVRTSVLVADGQTVVLGGLLAEDETRSEGVLPFFGNVPILGSAFRNRTTTTDETTLLILITPMIVRNTEQ